MAEETLVLAAVRGGDAAAFAAAYMRAHGESTFRLVSLNVLRVANGAIAEVTTFSPSLLRAFGLPAVL